MADDDKTNEVTEAHIPDGNLTKNTEEHQPGTTGWDKASVIIQGIGALVIVFSIITLILGVNQFKTQQSDSAMQTQDQEYQATLVGYLDAMSNLLLVHDLSASQPVDEVRVLAQSRTYEAVRNLDGSRKGTLVRFLWEAGLININGMPPISRPIISLNGADLRDTDLSGIDLSSASYCVSRAIVINCAATKNNIDLSDANLSGAILSGADLQGATYNTIQMIVNDAQGNPLTLEPTQWPQGFDPKAAGAICIDC
ncbi:MAG TPA: pentapeptide repeat-containing protein [Ktedonobacteraceae bacterium]